MLRNSSNTILKPNRNLVNGLKFVAGNSKYVSVTGFTPGSTQFVPDQPWTVYIACIPLSNTNTKPLGTNNTGSLEYFNLDVFQNGTVTYYWRNGVWGAQAMAAKNTSGNIKYIVIQNQVNLTNLWVNGKKYVTKTDGSNNVHQGTYPNTLNIGRLVSQTGAFTTVYFDGYILDVKIFTSFLSDANVAKLFNYGGGQLYDVPTASLAGWWKLDEKNGLSATDSSGNGYNGTLTNYTNAETASSGQPQSGNTAWVNAYSLSPITT
jgi:hypothetical protein